MAITPALLTRMSRPSCPPANSAANAPTDPRSARSSRASCTSASGSARQMRSSASAPLAWSRQARTTWAPAPASARAVWKPRPLFAPVTTAVRSASRGMSSVVHAAMTRDPTRIGEHIPSSALGPCQPDSAPSSSNRAIVATDPEVEPVVGLLPVGTDEAAAPGRSGRERFEFPRGWRVVGALDDEYRVGRRSFGRHQLRCSTAIDQSEQKPGQRQRGGAPGSVFGAPRRGRLINVRDRVRSEVPPPRSELGIRARPSHRGNPVSNVRPTDRPQKRGAPANAGVAGTMGPLIDRGGAHCYIHEDWPVPSWHSCCQWPPHAGRQPPGRRLRRPTAR